MAVLVTGSSGFIGRHLVDNLVRAHEFVIGFDATDPSSEQLSNTDRFRFVRAPQKPEGWAFAFREVFRNAEQPLTSIINLAANSHLPAFDDKPIDGFYLNTIFVAELLHARRDIFSSPGRIPFFLQIGSGEEFGPGGSIDRPEPPNLYGASKRAATTIVSSYGRDNSSTSVLHLSNVYGPGQQRPKFIPLAIERLSRNEVLNLTHGGMVMRSWVYVDDVIWAIREIMKFGEDYGVAPAYELGGEKLSLRSLTAAIWAELKVQGVTPGDYGYNPAEGINPPAIPSVGTFFTKRRHPLMPMQLGLSRTITAYLKQRES